MISDPLASLDLNRADVALRLVATLVATGQLIAGAQLIAERRLFERGGLLWWPAVRRRYQSSRFAVLSTMPFTPRAVIGTALLKCSGAVALVGCAVWQQPLRYALIVLLAANFALFIRMPHGRTGADEMGNVILLALLLTAIVDTPLTQTTCLVFIAGTSVTAYVTAGLAKLLNAGWRDGTVLRKLMSTTQYGHVGIARYLSRYPALSTSLSAALIAYECLFPLLLILPHNWAIAGLAAGALLHLTLAVVMGLNTFVWTFGATYPALLFANSLVQGW